MSDGGRTIGVVQARMGSTRLPGKVLEPIGDRPLVVRTVDAVRATHGIDEVLVATTLDASDDPLVELLERYGVRVHRGPVEDVLARVWDAVRPLRPAFVVRQTADNPFPDPAVMAAQLRRCHDALDYVGIGGWPLGIAGEVARAGALAEAAAAASTPEEREHVMPFLYRRPERYRLGSVDPADVPGAVPLPDARFTVDTAADLDFARALAARLGGLAVPAIADLRRVLEAAPELADHNRGVAQRAWQEAHPA